MYGTYIRQVVESANDDHGRGTAIVLEASTGEKLVKTALEPMCVDRVGFTPTVAFDYDTQVAEGVLTIYKYPGGVAGSKVALGTINLVDAAEVGKTYVVDLDNMPVKAASPYTGIKSRGLCDIDPGDQVAIWITTQASGGGYIAGDFQPFFCWHNRAETEEIMDQVVNLTPVKASANSNIHA